MEKFRRIFVVVMDSLGVGEAEDAAQFGDVGSNTLSHISKTGGAGGTASWLLWKAA